MENSCRYTLALPVETHPDVLRRLVALFTGSLDVWDVWEVIDGRVVARATRAAGNGLRIVEVLSDRMRTWGLQAPFTLVEDATATTMGECHRYAPALGILSQPWAYGQVWIDPRRLDRLVSGHAGSSSELLHRIRHDLLAAKWDDACPIPLDP